MTFEFTSEKALIGHNVWGYSSAAGAALCFLVLLVIGAVALHPKARAQLDRVSFRIVVYALFANMVLGITMAIAAKWTHPGFICGFLIFITLLTLHYSTFLFFCIALNLVLVVVYGVNGQAMEKFYVAVPALFALILVIPPYASSQYGWNPFEHTCWYASTEKGDRVVWQVVTQLLWTSLTVLGEVVCSSIVLLTVLRHNGRTRRIFVPIRSLTDKASTPQAINVHRYRYIIFRVSLYPITSCIVNLLSVATVINSSVVNNFTSQKDYNILLMGNFLYGGRTIIYALLAATDPALVRGVRKLFSVVVHGTEGGTSSLVQSPLTGLPVQRTTEVFVELDTVKTDARNTEVPPPEIPSTNLSAPPSDGTTEVDLAVDIELAKRSLDGHPPAAVQFAEGAPTLSAGELQTQERDRETLDEQRDDAFKKQI